MKLFSFNYFLLYSLLKSFLFSSTGNHQIIYVCCISKCNLMEITDILLQRSLLYKWTMDLKSPKENKKKWTKKWLQKVKEKSLIAGLAGKENNQTCSDLLNFWSHYMFMASCYAVSSLTNPIFWYQVLLLLLFFFFKLCWKC